MVFEKRGNCAHRRGAATHPLPLVAFAGTEDIIIFKFIYNRGCLKTKIVVDLALCDRISGHTVLCKFKGPMSGGIKEL